MIRPIPITPSIVRFNTPIDAIAWKQAISSVWFGVDLIAITRILRYPNAETDEADIAHRKQLCLLKRACIYIAELKEALHVKSPTEGLYSHLVAQQHAMKSVEEHTILGLTLPSSGVDDHTIAQILMEDLAAQSKQEYNSMVFWALLAISILTGQHSSCFRSTTSCLCLGILCV